MWKIAAMRSLRAASAVISAKMRASSTSSQVTKSAIHARTGLMICPHTAVGVRAAQSRRGDPRTPMVALATAHPAKFPDAVEAACGVRPALPERMADLMERPERVISAPNALEAIEAAISRELERGRREAQTPQAARPAAAPEAAS